MQPEVTLADPPELGDDLVEGKDDVDVGSAALEALAEAPDRLPATRAREVVLGVVGREAGRERGHRAQGSERPAEPDHALKARAAAAGMSFSEYLRTVLARTAARPTPEELAARIRARGVVIGHESSARSVRRLRDRGE